MTTPNREQIVYFIEHKETGLWWYQEYDYSKPKFITSFNGSRIRVPGFQSKDGWTDNPNDERIIFKSKEEAEHAVRSSIGVYPDSVEITEHEFVSNPKRKHTYNFMQKGKHGMTGIVKRKSSAHE